MSYECQAAWARQVDAYRAGAARCAGGGRLRGLVDTDMGRFADAGSPILPMWSARCSRRNRGWQEDVLADKDEPSSARVAESCGERIARLVGN